MSAPAGIKELSLSLVSNCSICLTKAFNPLISLSSSSTADSFMSLRKLSRNENFCRIWNILSPSKALDWLLIDASKLPAWPRSLSSAFLGSKSKPSVYFSEPKIGSSSSYIWWTGTRKFVLSFEIYGSTKIIQRSVSGLSSWASINAPILNASLIGSLLKVPPSE